MNQVMMVEGIPPNLNKYRNMHFHALDKEKKAWGRKVQSLVLHQRLKPIKGSIVMTYRFFFRTNARHDPDNYACCAKFINDALVENGILTDDSFEFIKELRIVEGGIAGVKRGGFIEVWMEEIKPSD